MIINWLIHVYNRFIVCRYQREGNYVLSIPNHPFILPELRCLYFWAKFLLYFFLCSRIEIWRFHLIWILMLFFVLVIYSMILFCVTSSFSLFDFSLIILLSDNFECGFYPILMSMLKYKLNYWILTIYFMIFEQELILVLLLTFCIKTFNENIILCFLLGLLFLDLLFPFFTIPFYWSFCISYSRAIKVDVVAVEDFLMEWFFHDLIFNFSNFFTLEFMECSFNLLLIL